MQLLEKLRSRSRHQQEKTIAGYQGLVIAVANNKAVKEDSAEAVLSQAGKTLDDLTADVERVRKRRKWAQSLADEAKIVREAEAAEARIAELQAELERVQEPIRQEIRLQTAITYRRVAAAGAALDARNQLAETAPPELVDRIARLRREINEHSQRAQHAVDRAHAARRESDALAQQTSRSQVTDLEPLREAREYAEQCADSARQAEAEWSRRTAELAELEPQLYEAD